MPNVIIFVKWNINNYCAQNRNEEAKKELTGMLPGKHDDTELESMLRSVQLSGALGSLTQAVGGYNCIEVYIFLIFSIASVFNI